MGGWDEMNTATQLRTWRKSKGLSQSQAAKLLDLSVRTWQEWEHGRTEPDARHRKELVKNGVLK